MINTSNLWVDCLETRNHTTLNHTISIWVWDHLYMCLYILWLDRFMYRNVLCVYIYVCCESDWQVTASVTVSVCYFRCLCRGVNKWDQNKCRWLLQQWHTCTYQLLQQQRNIIAARRFRIDVCFLRRLSPISSVLLDCLPEDGSKFSW